MLQPSPSITTRYDWFQIATIIVECDEEEFLALESAGITSLSWFYDNHELIDCHTLLPLEFIPLFRPLEMLHQYIIDFQPTIESLLSIKTDSAFDRLYEQRKRQREQQSQHQQPTMTPCHENRKHERQPTTMTTKLPMTPTMSA